MTRQIIQTEHAPRAIGPYSPAVVANGFVFTAGQVGIDPLTGKLVEGDITAQTTQAIKNVRALLEAAGTTIANVVKTTVFLHAMSDFQAMNKVYELFFNDKPPARTTVGNLDLPLGAQIEIEVVAVLPDTR
jgi:2-iminobutanoate/2-iminopropanoate deaminase